MLVYLDFRLFLFRLLRLLSCRVVENLWEAADIHHLAEGFTAARRAIDRAHIKLVLMLFIELFPNWFQSLAVSAPRCVKFDEPGLLGERISVGADDKLTKTFNVKLR